MFHESSHYSERERLLASTSDPIVIASAARTPVGSFQGVFSAVPAPQLGAAAIKAAVERAGVDPAAIAVEVTASHVGMAVDPRVIDHVTEALRRTAAPTITLASAG